MFMVMSSQQSHCESLPGSSDKCRTTSLRPSKSTSDKSALSAVVLTYYFSLVLLYVARHHHLFIAKGPAGHLQCYTDIVVN